MPNTAFLLEGWSPGTCGAEGASGTSLLTKTLGTESLTNLLPDSVVHTHRLSSLLRELWACRVTGLDFWEFAPGVRALHPTCLSLLLMLFRIVLL